MDKSAATRSALNTVTNQPTRKTTNQNDPLSKIRSFKPNKPNLVQHLNRSNPIELSSGLKFLQTRIQSSDDASYQPLVTISDNDDTEEEDFVSPIHKLTKSELREELKSFRQNDDTNRNHKRHTLLGNNEDDDDDAGDIEFRTTQPTKRFTCCSQYSFSLNRSSCTIS